MDETDAPEPVSTEPVAPTEPVPPNGGVVPPNGGVVPPNGGVVEPNGDEQLDGFDEDLESVASALDALDADDLATAEAFVEKLSVEVDPISEDPAETDAV